METEVNVGEPTNQDVDYKALYEESKSNLDARDTKVSELEGLIQKHKNKTAAKADAPSETQTFWKEDVQRMLKEERFYDANPAMSEHKEAMEKFTSDGYTLEHAKMAVLNDDPTIAARQNTNNSNFSDWVSWGGTKSYSQEDLYNLGQKDPALKRKAMEEISSGKATETI